MSPKQAVSVVVLLGASAAVWIPQFTKGSDSAGQAEDMSVPAEPDMLEASADFMPTGASVVDSAPPGAPPSGGVAADQLPDLEQLIDEAGAPSEAGPRDLDELLGSLMSFRPEGRVEPAPSIEPVVVRPQSEPGVALLDVHAALSEHPLTGILRAPSGDRVVMGSRVLRVGDEIVPGLAIQSVEARSVWIDAAGAPLEVELPPLRARARATQDNEDDSEGEGSSEPDDGEAEDQSETAPGA